MSAWVEEANRHIGLKEIKGFATNLTIKAWLVDLKAWWTDDEKPWCGALIAHCFKLAGIPLPRHWYRALDWLNWGIEIQSPCLGCVVVFSRLGGGHVGFVVGLDKQGRLMVLGGNQGDKVSIVPFDKYRVAGYRMPLGNWPRKALPILSSNLSNSKNEA